MTLLKWLEVIAADGTVYESEEAALKDWNAGKQFVVASGISAERPIDVTHVATQRALGRQTIYISNPGSKLVATIKL